VVSGARDEPASTATFRRALADPSILPSDLSVRFLVLLLLILASTASIYGYLALKAGPATERRAADCLSGTNLQRLPRIEPGITHQLVGSTEPVVACVKPDMTGVVRWETIGILLVIAVTYLSYRAAPLRRTEFPNGLVRFLAGRARRGRLRPLGDYDAEATAEVAALIDRLGLAPAPTVLVHPHGGSSFVFGTSRRPFLCLAGGLVRRRRNDPHQFTAVVLHELAHLKNRDNRPTYLTTAAWWSFVALAVVPYLALLVAPRLWYDPFGWRPSDLAASVENLHTTMSVAALVAVVYVTWLATLRSRELNADATAGCHDTDGVLLRYMERTSVDKPIRRPMFLRKHPSLDRRRSAVADPLTVPALSFAQMFGAGIGVSVLSHNLGTLAWQALLAVGFNPVPSPQTTFILLTVVAVGNIGPVGALAWLAGVTAWRARLRALVRPQKPPTLQMALGLGLVAGEPTAVSSANASRWGIFDGVGDGAVSSAVISALVLVGLLAALSRWSWDNAGAWLPVVRGSVRQACGWSAAIATIAVLPWYATWWAMHDVPLIGHAYVWTPGFAEALTFQYMALPWSEWLQVTYIPLDMLAWAPGVAVLTTLPIFAFTIGLLRRPGRSTPAWLAPTAGNADIRPLDLRPRARRAVNSGAVGCVVVLVVGFAMAWCASAALHPAHLNHEQETSFLHYLQAGADTLTIAVAAAAAGFTALRAQEASMAFGVLAALVVAGFGAALSPVLITVARCGPQHAAACFSGNLAGDYSVLYGFSGTAQPVKATVAAMLVVGVGLAVRWLGRTLRRRPSQPPAKPPLRPESRLAALIVTGAVTAFLAAEIVTGALLGLWARA
jgi:Zn-dependent protease with chaperone function